MEYGKFINGGKTYCIYNCKTPKPWNNILFNDEYFMEISQRLQGKSFSVTDYNRRGVLTDKKEFYINYNSKAVKLFNGKGNTCICEHSINDTVITESFDDFDVKATVFVPTIGKRELWTIEIINKTVSRIEIELFAVYHFDNIEYQGLECRYDTNNNIFIKKDFPYYIKYDDYEKSVKKIEYQYAMSYPYPDSYDCSESKFAGYDSPDDFPKAIVRGECTNSICIYEDSVAAFHNHLSIEPSLTADIRYIIGVEKDIDSVIGVKSFILKESFESEYKAVNNYWSKIFNTLHIDTTDISLNYYFNFWAKKQMIYLAGHNRGGSYCCVRNQLQDSIGYTILQGKKGLEYALKVLRRQNENGFLKQWYMTDGSPEKGLCLIRHSDACVWLIICMIFVIDILKDKSLLKKEEPYIDSDKKDSILIHLQKAAFYMADNVGSHGLCLILDGDWTDPANGPGRKGRGESVWNTMALIYGIKKLLEIENNDELSNHCQKLTEALNKYCWDNDRYIAGFDDDGKPFGCSSDDEASLFLNTQSWAVISGVADKSRTDIIFNTVEKLKTDCGYLLLAPEFNKWNSVWGKISVKQKGTTENGSVYCHGNMFLAYAALLSGKPDKAIDIIKMILPTNPKNPPEKNKQIPIFIANYYYGLNDEYFGQSSCVYSTGAPTWLFWIMHLIFDSE